MSGGGRGVWPGQEDIDLKAGEKMVERDHSIIHVSGKAFVWWRHSIHVMLVITWQGVKGFCRMRIAKINI